MSKAPYARAAFINAIAEEGTKAEAVKFLQETWNELCETRARLEAVEKERDYDRRQADHLRTVVDRLNAEISTRAERAEALLLTKAYLKGFEASAEGYNYEYPYMQFGNNPEEDEYWVNQRDAAIKELLK